MAVESEEILSKISDLIESKVDELTTNLNNFRQEASNNNQTLENAIGSIKSVIDEKLSKIDEISSEINSIQTSVQSVADTVSVTNNKIDNILSQQTQLQRTVDSVSQNIEKLSTVTSNQLTYLSNQSQNITEKIDKLSLQQEREARTAAVESARGTVVVDPATGKTVSGVAAADATGAGEETKQSLIGSVLSGIKGILTSPLALGGAALGAAALGTAAALRKEPPGTPQAGSDAEFNIPPPDVSGGGRTGGQRETGPTIDTGPTQKYDPNLKVPKSRQRRINNLDNNKEFTDAVKRISEKHNVTREDIYGIIQGESNYNPTLLSPGGGYGGLFQMGRGTLYGKQAWGRSYSSNEIRKLSPVQQILMYEKLLDEHKNRGWTGGREGLPLIQAAPASLSKNLDPNQDLGTVFRRYGVGQKYWRANPGWRSSPTGPITSKSISDYYYRRNRVNPLQRQETETAPQSDASRVPPQSQQSQQPDARREPDPDAERQPNPDVSQLAPAPAASARTGAGNLPLPQNQNNNAIQQNFSSEQTQDQPRQFPTQRNLSDVNEEVTSRFNELQGFVGPLKVISGYRSPRHNRRVGGARKSQHTKRNAIDIDVSHLSIEQRQELIKNASALGYKGIGVYDNSIHLDMGSRRYWGPNYSGNSLPGWARRVIGSHMSGRFNRDDLPKQQRERQRQPGPDVSQPSPDVSQPSPDVSQPSPDVSQPSPVVTQLGTNEASDSGVLGRIVTPSTPDHMNLNASGVVPPKKPDKDPYKQFERPKVDLKPSPPDADSSIADNMAKLMELLKSIKEKEKQLREAKLLQAQSQRQPVAGPLAGPYDDMPRLGQNGDKYRGTGSAPPPQHKNKPNTLNQDF